MIKYFVFICLAIGLFGCSAPTEMAVPDKMKIADQFSRDFINKIIQGHTEQAIADLQPDINTAQAQKFIQASSRNLKNKKVKIYKVVGAYPHHTTVLLTDKANDFTNHNLAYEYYLEDGEIIFFTTTIHESQGQFNVSAFNGVFIDKPLAELTAFSFKDKPWTHYVFVLLCILVAVFVLVTWIVMLCSKITKKKKVLWSVVILLLSIPKFSLDWNTGALDIQLLNFMLFGSGVYKPAIYATWILSVNIPIGAMIFWLTYRHQLFSRFKRNQTTEVDAA